jgi:hypothetical protein
MNLLVRLRRFIAQPLPLPAPHTEVARQSGQPGACGVAAVEMCVPVEALTGAARQRDPLGERHPCTWRTLLIKVAAEGTVCTRRIVVRLSSSWPDREWLCRVCERLGDALLTPAPHPSG